MKRRKIWEVDARPVLTKGSEHEPFWGLATPPSRTFAAPRPPFDNAHEVPLHAPNMAKARYEGGCHCGRVRMVVQGDLATAAICNCSICVKKGFIHLIVPPEDFELLAGREELATYEFGTGLAKHHFCRTCGMHPFYVPRSDPDKVDVNVRCLHDVDLGSLTLSTFDGQNWERAIEGTLSWR